jgi:esterase/lipase superfamily enzyme
MGPANLARERGQATDEELTVRQALTKWRAAAAGLGLALVMAPGLTGGGAALAGDGFNLAGLFGGGARQTAYTAEIFVASTRKGGNHSTELTPGAKARFSLDYISVPPDHKPGSIERPGFGGPNPDQHFMLTDHSSLDEDEFRGQIAAHLSGRIGANRDVLVYVHGFNTSLDDARFRLAQIIVDAKFGGVPVLFTWPSKAALLAYGADKESATASRDAYLNLLNDLAETPGIGRIHILAHSMGTWLTMETLREAALSGSRDLHGKLGNVMLAAPDIDLSVFKQQVARLDPSHFSVYVSKDDRALQVSGSIQGDRRLGSLDPGSDHDRDLIERLGVGVYDISDLSSNLIGHDNYADAPQVVRQIGARIEKVRPGEAETQSVIDAGADRTPKPPPGQIITEDLPAPAAPAAAAATPEAAEPANAAR